MPIGDKTAAFHSKQREKEMPAEDFANLLKQIKADLGLTWEQMGEKTGRAAGTLRYWGANPGRWVSRSVADDVIRRLAGEPLPPTARQKAEYTALSTKNQSLQRAETLQSNRLGDRKAAVAELRNKLGAVRLDEG